MAGSREIESPKVGNGESPGTAAARKACSVFDRWSVQFSVGANTIGEVGAWVYATEFFAWRQFRNRRQVGAAAGLCSTLRSSGDVTREQGISKAGNRYLRALAIELAWSWLRRQPRSALSQWYQRRFAAGGPRLRRIGIVALARKLLIALWRYLETDHLPDGALLKT